MSVVAGSQLQPPQVSELCLVTSTRSSLPAHFCSVAGQLFPVTSFERFLVAYVSNLLPNSARLYSNFYQEKPLVGAFSVIVKTDGSFYSASPQPPASRQWNSAVCAAASLLLQRPLSAVQSPRRDDSNNCGIVEPTFNLHTFFCYSLSNVNHL